jgi:hypothetical protein
MEKIRRILQVGFWALLPGITPALLMAQGNPSQNNYAAFELERDNNWDALILEDLNGDQLRDIIVSDYQPGIGRELLVYDQLANGQFSGTAKRIEIKSEIIAVGFADLREEPGKELVLFSNGGLFSLSSEMEGYGGNIRPLLEWDLIATMPDLEQVIFIDNIGDINGDGVVDFLLPGDGVYGYFQGKGDEQFELLSEIRSINPALAQASETQREGNIDGNISINAQQGIQLQFTAAAPSPYFGFIEQWQDSESDSRSLFRNENWMPSAILDDMNGDGLQDISYLTIGDDGLGQLNIHIQHEAGFHDAADWAGSLDTRGDLQLTDINLDGVSDLLQIREDGSELTARFYLNENGQFDFQQPQQIMRFSGYDVRLEFLDIGSNQNPVLSVSYYTIPVVDAIRNARINRTQLLYAAAEPDSGLIFNRRPDSQLEESFSANNVRGLSEQMSLQYDVDADGVKDALYITDNGTLAAKRIDSDLDIASQPFWEYVSPRTVFEFDVLQLNTDELPDLVLRHGVSSTILVARP